MLIMYGVYCIALSFNSSLERWAKSYDIPWLPKDEEQPAEQSALVTYKSLQEDRQGYVDPNTTAVDQPKTNEGQYYYHKKIRRFKMPNYYFNSENRDR